jgi:hypothetical protein
MLVAGIDLAAEPKGTALALVEWNNNQAKLRELFLGVDDSQIVEATKGAFSYSAALRSSSKSSNP